MRKTIFPNQQLRTMLLGMLFFIFCSGLNAQILEVVSSAGDNFENSNYKISWTLGEPLSETIVSNQLLLNQGFMQYFSSTVSVPDVFDKSIQLRIYPNPVRSNLYLSIDVSAVNQTQYSLFTITGIKLNSKILDKTLNQIDVSNIQPGIFYIQIINDQIKLNKTYKLIKL